MRHLFLINPRAGKFDRSQEMIERIHAAMDGRRTQWEAVRTQGPGHCTQLARTAAQQGDTLRIYACGGDGTLNEAVNGAAGWDNAAVTHFPLGSGNDFLRLFGRQAVRFQRLEELLDGPQAPMDLVECNGRYALNVCSVGFDARIGFGAADFKRLPLVTGSAAYQLSALRTIIRGIHLPYQVEIDGQALPGSEFTLMCACNGRFYGGGFNPSPTALPNDGMLEFVVVPAVSRLTVLTLIRKYARGEVGDIPQAILRRGREMSIRCDRPTDVNVDGELLQTREQNKPQDYKKKKILETTPLVW